MEELNGCISVAGFFSSDKKVCFLRFASSDKRSKTKGLFSLQ